jgi:oligoendopeptidase F
MKTEWNLGLLYKSDNDPQIEKDLKKVEKVFTDFEKKYKGKDFTSTPQKLKKALDDLESLEREVNGYKAWRYFNLKKDINTQDNKVQARVTQIRERMTVAGNKSAFFRIEIGKIPGAKQKSYLKSSVLKTYHYFLKTVFDEAKHHLSEAEEQLATLLAGPGVSAWTGGQKKLLTAQVVNFKGEQIPIDKAAQIIPELSPKDRQVMQKEINKVLKSISHFAEAELNAIFSFKKIMDEKRGFKRPYSSTVLDYQNEENTVETLLSLVKKHFKISHRFFRLQAKLQGKKKITYADRLVRYGKVKKKFDFDTTVKLVRESFADYDPKYAKILDSFLANGQIDVYPRIGKTGGGYCAGGGDNPTFILLNHTDELKSVATLAHEMGHAFHTELSRSQPFIYRSYSFSVAEVASTFFEQVMQMKLEKILDKKDYASFLHGQIMDDIFTIFNQVALFNCELEMNERVRKEGMLSAEEFAKIMSKHYRSFFGEAVDITDEDGYFFIRLQHIRFFFYVYSYAFGQLVSKALFEKWKEDKGYAKKIEQFLTAGGSASPEDIFKSIGIDVTDPKFFEAGLKSIEKDIAKLEKLVATK